MKKVLLADEDASVRQMVARVLQVAGYLPLLAASPQEAVLAFRDGLPDLVVLDLTSPDDEGWQAFEQMRQIDALVPVILITSRPNQADQAMRRGITTLTEKPLDLTGLLQMIAFLLEESEKQVMERLARPSSIHQHVGSS